MAGRASDSLPGGDGCPVSAGDDALTLLRRSAPPPAPVLVFGYGNPSRGDDALGPLVVERLRTRPDAGARDGLDLLSDFQLQVEHALDLRGRTRVIFVDAARGLGAPFRWSQVAPARVPGWTTHRMTPSALAAVYRDLFGPPPVLELLAIGGERFELGELPSAFGRRHLDAACADLERALGVAPARAG
jgi:hydrogenase maturation protease